MIGVLGAGSWGTALAVILANKQPKVTIPVWGHDPEHIVRLRAEGKNQQYLPDIELPKNLAFTADLPELMAQVKDVLVVVPSNVFSQVLMQIKPHFTKQHRLLWATKGIEPDSGRFLHQAVRDVLGDGFPIAMLSGPSFAKEVAKRLPTAVTIAGEEQSFLKDLQNYFHTGYFRVYLNEDIIGVQLGGVVKNILAVAAGISDGLQYGANARAALLTRGLVEMNRLGKALGAESQTLQGLSGIGDVILTATDNQSRNKRFGMALAVGKTVEEAQLEIGQVVEAVHNVKALCKLAQQYKLETPIIDQVNAILEQEVTPKEAVARLLNREPVYE